MFVHRDDCRYFQPDGYQNVLRSAMAETFLFDASGRLFNRILLFLPCLQAALTSTILYRLLVTFAKTEGHKVREKQKLLGSFSPTFLNKL